MKKRYFRIKITRSGWLFIFLCFGVGASAINTGNNLIYLVFGTMLSFLILSGLLSNNTLQKLRIRPSFPHRIFAGQPVWVQLELENRKRFIPSFALSLFPVTDGKRRSAGTFITKIPASQRVCSTDHVVFPKRGHAVLPPYAVETAYPFGLIQKQISIPSAGETIVYPKLVDVEPHLGQHDRLHGEYLSGQRGGTANPYGIRDFVFGDPARLIHWKSSAKQRKWKVKEFEREKRLRIVLDVWLGSDATSSEIWREAALSTATSLLLNLTRRGIEVALRLNGRAIRIEGRGYLDAYLTALALAGPAESTTVGEPMEEFGTTIVVTDQSQTGIRGDLIIGREQLEAA